MRYLIKFSYDGSNYCGYQVQPGLDTIQERLEFAAKKINNDNFYDLIDKSETEMSKIRNLGKKSLKEVIDKVKSMGLKFRDDN